MRIRRDLVVCLALFLGLSCGCGEEAAKGPMSDEAQMFADAVNNNKPEIIRQMTEQGVNPNIILFDGTTVLHAAAGMGRVECAQALLEGGADVHISDNKGRTPLHWVAGHAMSDEAQRKLAKLLVDAGSKLDAKDSQGRTPLDCAVQSGNNACADILGPSPKTPDHPSSHEAD